MMMDMAVTESTMPLADEQSRPSSDSAPLWLVLCAVCLFAAVLVAAGFVANRLLTRDLVAARAVDARLQAFESAVEGRPGDVGARVRLAYAYQQNGLHREALDQYAEVLAANPGNSGALYNTGLIQLARGQASDGEATMSRLLELEPSHALAAQTLAERHSAQGEFARALAVVLPAADAHPENADLQYLAGLAYEKTGRTDAAILRYRSALRLVPGMSTARSALGRLGGAR